MNRKPTATESALYPAPALRKCSCGVLFAPRPRVGKEHSKKCLTCNRKGWSVLHGFEKPGHAKEPVAEVAQIADRKRSR